jgi:hypothetical protein
VPLYDLQCKDCGATSSGLMSWAERQVRLCACGGQLTNRNFRCAAKWREGHEPVMGGEQDSRNRYKEWVESDSVRAKVKSGEWDVDTSGTDSLDGPGTSSCSIQESLDEAAAIKESPTVKVMTASHPDAPPAPAFAEFVSAGNLDE